MSKFRQRLLIILLYTLAVTLVSAYGKGSLAVVVEEVV